jgi:mRNA interferase RelE/StbE
LAWKIKFEERARKELKRLDIEAGRRILRYLEKRVALSAHPRQMGHALKGNKVGLWRYRVGDYRLVCRIEDETLTVLVVAVGHRATVYN